MSLKWCSATTSDGTSWRRRCRQPAPDGSAPSGHERDRRDRAHRPRQAGTAVRRTPAFRSSTTCSPSWESTGDRPRVNASGDLEMDAHHTVEDVGIAFGEALAAALGDKAGIRRFASVSLPLDEALVDVAIDCSGRPFLRYDVASRRGLRQRSAIRPSTPSWRRSSGERRRPAQVSRSMSRCATGATRTTSSKPPSRLSPGPCGTLSP